MGKKEAGNGTFIKAFESANSRFFHVHYVSVARITFAIGWITIAEANLVLNGCELKTV